MNGLIQYILSVTAAAILTAIVRDLAGQGNMRKLVEFIGGIFMALTLISPLMKLELPDVENWLGTYAADGEAAAAVGEEMAGDAARAVIKARVEAYILDKAAVYSAAPTVEVELDAEGLPAAVTVAGDISPYAKARLAQMMEADLGLGEEAQTWIS